MKKFTTTTLVAASAALALTGCSLFGPSLQDRATTAAETIDTAVQEENAATAKIEAAQSDVRAQIDSMDAELEAAIAEADAAFEKADAAAMARDWDAPQSEIDADWAEYDKAVQKVTELEAENVDRTDPLYAEIERLDAAYAATLDSPLMAMGFALMVSCPELLGSSEGSLAAAVPEVEVTESCVESLEGWAVKVG